MRGISLSSRRKLKPIEAQRFAHMEPKLFCDLARVVCSTGVVPQKELHESWHMACSVHSEFPDYIRVADLAAGHGLLAWIFVLLARSAKTPILRTAVAIDIKRPKSADILAAAIIDHWPDLAGTFHYVEGSIDAVWSENGSKTLFVAAHACGSLSDRVLLAAINSQSALAIMPCCHSLRRQIQTLESLSLASGLQTYTMDEVVTSASKIGQPKAIDQVRIDALTAMGYKIIESTISEEITSFNRIIMGKPQIAQSNQIAPNQPVPPSIRQVKHLGGIRAFEKVQSINVDDATELQTLSLRPSLEWLRSFDLSYWVEDTETGQQLAQALELLLVRFLDPRWIDTNSLGHSVSVCDQYNDPRSQKLAFTYRIKFGSRAVEITKADANALRNILCQEVANMPCMHGRKIELRV